MQPGIVCVTGVARRAASNIHARFPTLWRCAAPMKIEQFLGVAFLVGVGCKLHRVAEALAGEE